MKLYLDGIGLNAPGLPDWPSARAVFAGQAAYRPAELVLAASPLLPPAERRRMTGTIKLALGVCSEAVGQAGVAAADLPSVFTSSGGDGATITAILEILAGAAREVSPTQFHNSVHNAPSGYWGIATQSLAPSTTLCAHDFSFAAGLLDAATQILAGQCSVLLASYDLPYPPALHSVRAIEPACGVALVLAPRRGARSLAALSLHLVRDAGAASTLADPALEALRRGNPAARALPLLAAVAAARASTVVLEQVAGAGLVIEVAPAVVPAQ